MKLQTILNDFHFINSESGDLSESSWSTIVKHIQNGSMFSVVSACRGLNPINGWNVDDPDITMEEATQLDEEAHVQLKRYLKEKGYGYIEQKSVYDNYPEKSFFVPGMPKMEALNLGRKYQQKSIIFKDSKEFCIYYTLKFSDWDGDHQFGDAGMSFAMQRTNNGEGKTVMTFDPAILKFANSQILRGSKSQTKKSFAFVAEQVKWFEFVELKKLVGLKAYKEGRPTEFWKEIIL